jgi:hypothetical protein
MSTSNENDENINESVGYELYVINSGDTSCYQRLEFFYDFISDPNNQIKITKVKGVYAYKDNNGIITSGDTIDFENDFKNINLTNVTLYFTKENLSESDMTVNNCLFAKYNESESVDFTIYSVPSWWKILSVSDYVREVKKGDILSISLEDEIPTTENTYVSLQNKLGAQCSISIKSQDNIFNKTTYNFGLTSANTSTEIDTNLTFPFSANSDNVVYLHSQASQEEIYYITQEFNVSNTATTISAPTVKYPDKRIVKDGVAIINESFDILYNQNIDKYYINYSSIAMNGGIKEKKDNIVYYFENNTKEKIFISIPLLSSNVPWNVVNNGGSVVFDVYKGEEGNNLSLINDNHPTFFPASGQTPIHILTQKPTNNIKQGEIYLITKSFVSEIDDTSCVIFQQITTYSEAYLYIEFKSANSSGMVNKYGDNGTLDNMINISFATFQDAISAKTEPNVVKLEIPRGKEKTLYYTSFKKIDNFTTQINNNVNFYIPKTYEAKNTEAKFDDMYIDNENGTNNDYSLHYGTTSYLITNIEEINVLFNNDDTFNDDNKIEKWKLADGYLNIYYLNRWSKVFPNDPVYIVNAKRSGIFIYQNIPNKNYRYYAIVFNTNMVIEINGETCEITSSNESGGTISVNSYYELIPKSVTLDGAIYRIENGNAFVYNNVKHDCYQNTNGEWQVNLPSLTFTLSGDKDYITIQNTNYHLVNNVLTYNDVEYYATTKVSLPLDFKFNLLRSVDGIEDEKDYYLVVNNKKMNITRNKKINLTPFVYCDIDNEYNYAQLKNEYSFDLLNTQNEKYVIIDWTKYSLINNSLIYEGVEYSITTTNNNKEFIVIGKMGYKVREQVNETYCIINNEKYIVSEKNELKVKEFISGPTDSYFVVDELFNQTFKYSLDMDNLLDSPMITAQLSNNAITNAYVKIDEKYYPTKKQIYLDDDYNILNDEYITIPSSSYVSSAYSMTFLDESELVSDNNENFNQIVTSGEIISGNLTADISFRINDYSEVKFEPNILIRFENDCIVKYKNGNDVLEHKFNKNELLYINSVQTLTFTDIVTITLVYHTNGNINVNVFKNIAVHDETNEIYYPSIINGQEAIIYNKNIYYIYNKKVTLDNNNNSGMTVYDKYIYIKELNNNGQIVFKDNYEVSAITSDSEYRYGYITNDGENDGQKLEVISTADYNNIEWKIYLPTFNTDNEKITLQQYSITNFQNTKIDDNARNQFAVISGYTRYSGSEEKSTEENIDIENGKFQITIDCYKVNVMGDTVCTNELLGNNFTLNGKQYSIWDYYGNTYIKQAPIYDYIEKTLDTQRKLQINNVVLNVDENKYVEIKDGEMLEIHATTWTKIDDDTETKILYFWDVNEETISSSTFNIVSVPTQKQPSRRIASGYTLFYTSETTDSTVTTEALSGEIETINGLLMVTIGGNIYQFLDEGATQGTQSINRLIELIERDYSNTHQVFYREETETKTRKIILTPLSGTILNENNELQTASDYQIYDDNNEKYEFYVFHDGKPYNVNFKTVTIPTNEEFIKNDDGKITILYNIYSYLTHNMSTRLSNEVIGTVKKISFRNKIDIPHSEDVIIEVTYRDNDNNEQKVYGKCIISFE